MKNYFFAHHKIIFTEGERKRAIERERVCVLTRIIFNVCPIIGNGLKTTHWFIESVGKIPRNKYEHFFASLTFPFIKLKIEVLK